MANALKQLFIDIADAIRAKTGGTATMKPAEFVSAIESVSAGGGSSEDVRYVTFMNGDEVLYVKPVAVGDDCADVLTRGFIETPTKESTAQYNFTYSGWSLTDGGSADTTNALANVTEDRTVFAAYTESVRYYTITYYDTDGATVLNTEELAYGTTPTYIPSKTGYAFGGWSTELVAVTSNASYIVASWKENVTFATSDWSAIAAISEAGLAKYYFAVGDSRAETITYDGNTYDVTLKIAGFDHDTLADGSGKAGMTIMLHTAVPGFSPGVTQCLSNTPVDYPSTDIGNYCNTFLETYLPSAWTHTKEVSKEYNRCYNNNSSLTIQTAILKAFLPSVIEAGWDRVSGVTKYIEGIGTTYELYSINALGEASVPSVAVNYYSTTYPKGLYDYKQQLYSRNAFCNTFGGKFSLIYYQISENKTYRSENRYSSVFGFCI